MRMIFKIVQGYLTKEGCKLGHKRIVKNLLASSKKNEMCLKKVYMCERIYLENRRQTRLNLFLNTLVFITEMS